MTNGWAPKDCIAVLGAARKHSELQLAASFCIGREIARRGKALLTGSTTGIPYAAALGAHLEGGIVIGISPGGSIEEHVSRYAKPVCQADVLIFTGMGPDGRSPLIMRSAKGAVFIGGELGTLGEWCSGWMCGKNVLGVLQGFGGIADVLPDILSKVETSWGSQVICEADPVELARKVCDAVDQNCSFHALCDPTVAEPDDDVKKFVTTLIDREGLKR